MAVAMSSSGLPAAWWETFEDPPGYRAEVIMGELVLSPSPGRPHQRAVTELVALLRAECPGGYEVLTDMEWRLDRGGVVAQAPRPDLVVVHREDGPIVEPPLLAVEILSPSDYHPLPSQRTSRIEGKRLDYLNNGLDFLLEIDPGAPSAWLSERVIMPEMVWRGIVAAHGDKVLRTGRPFPFSFRPSELFSVS